MRARLLVPFFLAAVVGAQQPDPFARLDARSRYAIEAMIDSAGVQGLPADALRSLALQGIQKGAPSRVIVDAVRRLFGNLREARAILGPVNNEDLKAAAGVLEITNVKPAVLAPFKDPPKGRSLATALTVLGDLLTRGVPRDDASSAVVGLWKDGAGEAEFTGLFRRVEGDILRGLNPGAALQNWMREYPGRGSPSKVNPPPESPDFPSS